MFVETIVFVLGFFLGLIVSALLIWTFFSKKMSNASLMLKTAETDNKQLMSGLSDAHAQVAILTERLTQVGGLREELSTTKDELVKQQNENGELMAKLASLRTENDKTKEFFEQRIQDLSSVHENMKQAFSSISESALLKNSEMLNLSFKQSLDHFFKTTEKDRMLSNENLASIMKPLKESLTLVDKKVSELESSRQGAYAGLKEQIEGLLSTQTTLQKETQNLARALNAPTVRGRWGEMQLRRVVELSGLSAHCDFVEQQNVSDGDDTLRPDMIVTLPRNKKIIIDAKAPLEIFAGSEENVGARDEQRATELATSLRRHLLLLKKKSYHSMLGQSPEFVVMFLPGEAFLHWALVADPNLLDFAAQNEIILATPITLVALLKAIAFGFKQESIANNIEEVRHLSQQLIDRIHKVSSHFEKLGRSLKQATESYNQTLASLDSRVLVTARRLSEIKSFVPQTQVEISESLPYLDSQPREVSFKKSEDV